MNEIAISVDIEADGPTIGINSLRSIGAVAYDDKTEIGQFEVNIVQHGMTDPSTMLFWEKHPEAWEALREGDVYSPDDAMHNWNWWLREIAGSDGPKLTRRLRFVAWPCWFDYGWVRQYSLKYTGIDYFERRVFELGQAWHLLGMKPPKVHNDTPHVALADAIEQGEQYIKLLNWFDENGGRPWQKKSA